MLVGKIHKNCVISRKPFMIGTFLYFIAVYCGRFIALILKQFGEYIPQMNKALSHLNGRETDSKILSPFVPVRMRFLSVPHAVKGFRVR